MSELFAYLAFVVVGIFIGVGVGLAIGTFASDNARLFRTAQTLARNALALMADGDLSNARYTIQQITHLGED